jgi:DNA-binding NarL/FixJ family response regulator
VSGAVIVFVGALFARSQLSRNVVTGSPKPNRQHSQELRDTDLTTSSKLGGPPQDTPLLSNQTQLEGEERQMLWLLAEGLSDAEIAARMNLSDMQARLVKSTLLNTFGAADKIELIKLARTQGLLPPN